MKRLIGAMAILLAACGGGEDGQVAAGNDPAAPAADTTAAASAPGAAAPATDDGPKANAPVNELGKIMVLEYHRLGNNEGEWIRTLANYRKDLQSLYDAGFRPITMRDVAEGNIDVPAGTTPVVFTFDDSSLGQFYYRPDGSIDPNTMVGSWADFQKKNPAWKNGGVWCILPAAGHPSNFFSEKPDKQFASREERETNIRKKVTYLVENGHEICNHTLFHARLDRAKDDAQAQEYIGRGDDSISVYLPKDYDIVTFALPLGMWPKNRSLAWRGNWKGKPYEYSTVLEVSGGPNVSPYDKTYDPRSVDRFIVAPGALERQLAAYKQDPSSRYVSDGDPNTISVPANLADRVDRARWPNKTVKTVAAAAAPVPAGAAGAPAASAPGATAPPAQ